MPNWLNEFEDVSDKRVLWDLIKYRVRQVSLKFAKEKARKRRDKMSNVEISLRKCEEECNINPSSENIEKCDVLREEYNSLYNHLLKEQLYA